MDSTIVAFEKVSKSYDGRYYVVRDLDLRIERGEFLTLLGPSGSGKTTTLMMLAGFEIPTSGEIYLDGRPMSKRPPHERGIGIVFQNYALFPHMTVAENLAFPLEVRSLPRAEIAERVRRALDMVQLPDLGRRWPHQLSGGQQQRVALARALVFEPSLVLMDEPLGALDKQLREHMQYEIRALHERLGVTVVYVTHDQGEALTLSDRIAVIVRGRIRQIAAPMTLYEQPADLFVATFIGESIRFRGKAAQRDGRSIRVTLAAGGDIGATPVDIDGAGSTAEVIVRPERIVLGEAASACANCFQGTVADVIYRGDHLRVRLNALGADRIVAKIANAGGPPPSLGSDMLFGFRAEDARAFALKGPDA
jgi:putative spermidine/putrescine transport system ATP-binding protein